MRFNPGKCKTMRITSKRNPDPTSYKMLGVTLEETNGSQYLGINIQNDLRWNKQVEHTKSKASRVLNFLRRNFHHTSTSVKEKLYTTLETSSWLCHSSVGPLCTEKYQRSREHPKCSSLFYGKDTSVSALKAQLGWHPLQERRRRGRLACFL